MDLRKTFRRGLITFQIIIVLLSAAVVGAAVQIFDGTGQYIMSDFENHDIALNNALNATHKKKPVFICNPIHAR